MKAGSRALGIAESSGEHTSTLAGCVVRANRTVDGLSFASCTVGGTDATDAILEIIAQLDREDIQYLFVAGIAPAWFNIVDLHRLHDTTDLPSISISFEGSPGLTAAISDAFEGTEREKRLSVYQSQPDRQQISLEEGKRYIRGVGIDSSEAARVIRAFTPAGGRPEPVRVARMAARAGEAYR